MILYIREALKLSKNFFTTYKKTVNLRRFNGIKFFNKNRGNIFNVNIQTEWINIFADLGSFTLNLLTN